DSSCLSVGDAGGDGDVGSGKQQLRVSRLHATFVETMARGQQDRLATSRRVTLSRVVSTSLVISTTASCLVLYRNGLTDLALGRMSVALLGLLWFWSTFTEVFKRDTGRVCNGISFLCFALWSFSHIVWHATSSEAASNSSGSSSSGSSSSGGGTVDA
ncbi:unnamed protein product, partial [Laminaria digitata]